MNIIWPYNSSDLILRRVAGHCRMKPIERRRGMKTTLLVLVTTLLTVPTLAGAQYLGQHQGYTIISPGEPPTFVNPNFNGGYTAITPGEPPTFINRSFNGGYTVITPGEAPAFINPTIPLAPRTSRFFGEDDAGDD